MRAVGLKVLKNRLSEYVRMAAAGETVLVTDRERVVARLVPPLEGEGSSVADAQRADLVRRGILTPARIRSSEPPPRRPVMSWEELERQLAADREDR